MRSRKDAWIALSNKRFHKRLKREKLKRERRSRLFPKGDYRPYKSKVLDLFCKLKIGRSDLEKLSPRTFMAPSVFSISKNTKECLDFFRDIVTYARTARRPRITLDQKNITNLGLGADSVLGVLLYEIKLELRYTIGSFIRGFKPRSKKIQTIMDEIGSVRALFMDIEDDIKVSFSSRAKVFRHRHKPSLDGDSDRNNHKSAEVIQAFSDHLNSCLITAGRELTIDGRDSICHYAGEIIDNVQEHSGMGEWLIVGYSNLRSDDPIYRCVIFCFGKTIYDTFNDLPEGSYPLRVIEPYIVTHRGGGLFTREWREEDLTTLVAMQGDVSSKSVDEYSDRGQGTVELIQFFQGVVDECGLVNFAARSNLKAEMNIVSGSTRIRFDGMYRMQFRHDLNRDIIAFNQTNDLYKRPDPKAIMSLGDSKFPGTLVSIEIPISTASLTSVHEDEYEN